MITCMTFDLDGTLLNHESKLSAENVQSLKEAQEKGIEIIVATGRNYPDVVEIFKKTGIKTWIIAANGATIHTPDGKLFCDVPMEKEKALELLKWLEEHEYYYEVFSKNYLYTKETARELIAIEMDRLCTANPNIDRAELEHHANTQFSQTNFSFIASYQDLKDESIPVYNILAFSFDQKKLAKGWETFKDDTSVTLVTSGKYNFEFEHLLASKGHALTKLTNHLGISLQNTLAMGDSMNDLSMLALVGYPVAMGNAREDVKATCLEVADTNDQHGVAKTINKVLNKMRVAN